MTSGLSPSIREPARQDRQQGNWCSWSWSELPCWESLLTWRGKAYTPITPRRCGFIQPRRCFSVWSTPSITGKIELEYEGELRGAEQVAFSVTTPSGSHLSDSIAWIERLIRAFGSPNTIYATEICNWHKDFASRLTYGTDIGTPDFAHTGCVLLWGNNPAATWLARATEVQKVIIARELLR